MSMNKAIELLMREALVYFLSPIKVIIANGGYRGHWLKLGVGFPET